MEPIKKIIVSIQFSGKEQDLGELIFEGKSIYFKYYADFLKQGLEISPFKLKLSSEIYAAPPVPFDGLFGVFADSLPDAWGKLLLDRSLQAHGIDRDALNPLDRLAYLGTTGMGALNYRPIMETNEQVDFYFELDDIAKASQNLLAGYSSDILDELYQMGGSSGGARPKILVGYDPKDERLIATHYKLPKNYEHWLIKFPSSYDRTDIANIEFAYYQMALAAGIEMSESRLFTSTSGQTFFGTKRFDRNGNARQHMHSAAGLLHDNFRLSTLDYGHLMDATFKLEKNVKAYEKILRLAAFNVFAHNRDDHSKNFSFLMSQKGHWQLAPAYDLTFSNSGHGMHSTMVAGESAAPTKKHLLQLASYFQVKKGKEILEEVELAVHKWKYFADASGVSKASKKSIAEIILKKK